jgi:dUTP pyrophosphatase
MILKYFKVHQNVVDPNYQTKMAACFDLAAYIPKDEKVKVWEGKETSEIEPQYDHDKDQYYILLMPGERAMVRTGLTFDIPSGYSIRLHPRSGMVLKYGLTLANCEGVIDEDYTYETKLIMINTNLQEPIKIYNRDRIAQGEVVKYEQVNFGEIYNQPGLKTDRVGGFGSTGIN